ncbi:hypothetical protein M0R45_016126 [Rubus argutus]|uniref:hydroxymethylglutaryl-CoA lyase n=1 Tax=Rubus argutus TaxID=59490 RepID=A0AAW1XTK5_RUBAR
MSSLEEPLGFDKLPSMSSIDRIQKFSSSACRSRADDVAMGNCWIEGRSCSTSNSCDEDYEEYTREGFPWRIHTRDYLSQGDSFNTRTLSLGRNNKVFRKSCDSWYLPDHQYNSNCNDKNITHKFLKGIPTVKIELIHRLVSSGLPVVEATSFVSPKWVPQLADAKDVMDAVHNLEGARFPVLTPNLKGFEAAIAAGAKDIAVFASASESFSSQTSIVALKKVFFVTERLLVAAKELSIPVRGYVSCAIGCPVEGAIPPSKVAYVAKELYDMGCFEISLGDTIGVGTPGTVVPMLEAVMAVVPVEKLAVHFHDTYGQSLSNILVSLQAGIGTVDSSIAGLGGCPYAKGASGNVATEDVVYMLNGLGVETNVDLAKLLMAGDFICRHLGRPSGSKTAIALSRVTADASKI